MLTVTLQVLMDLRLGHTVLRLGLSDLLLPLVFILLLWQAGGRLPLKFEFSPYSPLLWLLLATIWLLLSLAVGRLNMGQWSYWALINKGLGWFVLLGYLLAGVLAAHVLRRRVECLVAAFVFAAWLIGWYFLLAYVPFKLGITQGVDYMRISGLFANPNAYGLAVVTALLLQLPFMRNRRWAGGWLHAFGVAVLLFNLFLSGSRSALLATIVAAPLLVRLRVIDLEMVKRVLTMAALIAACCFWAPAALMKLGSHSAVETFSREAQGRPVYLVRARDEMRHGINLRMTLTRRALELWSTHPVIGTGLGYFLWDQRRQGVSHPLVIHNTGLWLLTETGVVGLLLFAALFLSLWLRFRHLTGREPIPLYPGLLAMMLAMLGASVGTEVMYQRYFWFFLGLGLAARQTLTAGDRGRDG